MTTISVSTFRDQMLRLLEEDRSFEFLTRAEAYLDQCGDDDQIRLFAAREYLKLGWVGPASDLLDPDRAGGTMAPELADLRSQLQELPAQTIRWSSRQGRFERNLKALDQRGIGTSELRRAWGQQITRFELFCDRGGHDHVRMRDDLGRWKWIPYLGDHQAAEANRALPEDIKSLQPGPYLFEGLDLGHYFHRVYGATLDTFLGYGCPLFVVEPEAALLSLVFHLHEWAELLADPRTFWFFGSSGSDRLIETLEGYRDLPWPAQAFGLSAFRTGPSPEAIDKLKTAANKREEAIADSLADLNRRYADRDLAYWAKRFEEASSGRGRPFRVLSAVSTHTTFLQYSMGDAHRAFEAIGCECRLLMEQAPFEVISPLSYHEAIRELDPDVFFVLDHLRSSFSPLIPGNLPVLTWDQDQLPHVFTPANMRQVPVQDFITGYTKVDFVRAGCDARQYLSAQMPTCPQRFDGPPLTDTERRRYECDVSYVSHASQTPQAFHDEERSRCGDPHVVRLLDTLYELLPEMLERYRVVEVRLPELLIKEACRRCDLSAPSEALRERLTSWYLWRLGDRIFRHEALEWTAKWAARTGRSFRIYGNGWDEHPTLSDFAAGPAENGRELLCVYRASRINLQLMPAGFIHQRALDGLAAGGFFLTRLTPHDAKGGALRRLVERISELGIADTAGLFACDDLTLKKELEDYRGEWLEHLDPNDPNVFWEIMVASEVPVPDEAFPNFGRITFDSEGTFAAKADLFLGDPDERRRVADEMRQVVSERFTYQAAMGTFLRAMSGYLAYAADRNVEPSTVVP